MRVPRQKPTPVERQPSTNPTTRVRREMHARFEREFNDRRNERKDLIAEHISRLPVPVRASRKRTAG
eukprot:2316396-Rhodomonas_salina.1